MNVRAYTTDDLATNRPVVLQTTHHETPLTIVEVRLLASHLNQMVDGIESADPDRLFAFTIPIYTEDSA